ncbi:MAG: class I SAM-dependent methyltransferase [Candidatus Levybacteria bacterium]|nr:class I SAM-dependent methyltransferase [Candidatus Levybacteria bacterium]
MNNNIANILSLLEKDIDAKVLDVGCGDGQYTIQFRKKISSHEITGVDGVLERLYAAKRKGVDKIQKVELEEKWPFQDNHFDVIISNQVIEHILNIDHFISEIYRILKPGGYCVISTENLSSWHNIFALVLGFQDFSHHILKKVHTGNPMSLHFGEKTATWSKKAHSGVDDTAYPHIKILTYISLIGIFNAYNFHFERGLGSGYYPLFSYLGKLASKIDPRHSHLIAVKMRKGNTSK